MASLFNQDDRTRLLERLERLSPDSRRQWGKMTPAQMQVHIADQLRIALGTLTVKPKSTPLAWPPVRWLVIHSPMPWPKGAPTAPELMNPVTANWHSDRARLIADIQQVASRGETADWAAHPAFGKLSSHSWGVLMWRHMDHHLRQFSL